MRMHARFEQLRVTGRCDVYEKAYIARDGRRIPILIGASILEPSASDPEVAAFVTDLTPLKMAEAALRAANEELERKSPNARSRWRAKFRIENAQSQI